LLTVLRVDAGWLPTAEPGAHFGCEGRAARDALIHAFDRLPHDALAAGDRREVLRHEVGELVATFAIARAGEQGRETGDAAIDLVVRQAVEQRLLVIAVEALGHGAGRFGWRTEHEPHRVADVERGI